MSSAKCEVCGSDDVIGVASSSMGAISLSWCLDCAQSNREPWHVLVGGLVGLKKGEEHEGIRCVIEETCAFYGKTEDQLWEEVQKMDSALDAYMRRVR